MATNARLPLRFLTILCIALVLPAVVRANGNDWVTMLGTNPGPKHHDDQYSAIGVQLHGQPVRDIRQDARSRRFLSRHPVFVSMTTTPSRIDHIHHVVETIDFSLVSQ